MEDQGPSEAQVQAAVQAFLADGWKLDVQELTDTMRKALVAAAGVSVAPTPVRPADVLRAARAAFPGHVIDEASQFKPTEIAAIVNALAPGVLGTFNEQGEKR